MKYLDKIGYRERIMAAFSMLTIAIILVLYLVISYSQEKMLSENLQNRIDFFSSFFQTVVFEETDSLNVEKYDLLLDTFGEYRSFKFFQLVDSDYNFIRNKVYDYDFFNSINIKPFSELGNIDGKLVNEIHDTCYDIILPISVEDKIKYYARVGFDFSYLKRVSDYNKDYYILTFIVALIIANLLSFLIGNSLDRKIRHLVNYTKSVSEGNLDLQFDFKWGHELGNLASAFNTMVNKLEESQG